MTATPLERQIVFDIAPALGALRELEQAFEATYAGIQTGLSNAISSAITDGLATDITIPEPDASAVGTAVSQAIGEGVAEADVDVELEATADTTEAQDAIDDLEGETVTVGVDADPGPIEEVSEATDEASQSAEGAEQSFGALSGTTGELVNNVATLTSGLADFNAGAGAAAISAAGLFAAAGIFASAAIEAETATTRFNRALGSMADEVRDVDMFGLNTSLEDLAILTGSSDEALQLAAARIADLGRSSGASSADIGEAAETISILAANAVALNPTLGDTGEVADQLTNALARGGRALSRYGISISAAEIEQQALIDTGKESTAELTIFERSLAGARIATEQFGGSLEDLLEVAQASPALRIRALGEQFGEGIEAIGAPLIENLIEVLEQAVPAGLAFAEILGQIAEDALPLIPLALQIVTPILQTFADIIEQLPDEAIAFATAALTLSSAVGSLSKAFQLLGKASISVPQLAAVAAVAALATAAFAVFADETDELADAQADVQQELFGTAATASEVQATLAGLGRAFDQLVDSTGDQDDSIGEFVDSLNTLGVTNREAQEGLLGSRDAFEEFRAAAIAELPAELRAVDKIMDEVNRTFEEQRQVLRGAVRDELNYLVETEQITEAQKEAALAGNEFADGTTDLVGALEDASAVAAAHERAIAAEATAAADAAGAFDELRDATLRGVEVDPAVFAAEWNLSLEEVQAVIDETRAGIDEFVESATSALPRASEAFSAFTSGIDQATSDVASAEEAAISSRASAEEALAEARVRLTELEQEAREAGPDQAEAFAARIAAAAEDVDAAVATVAETAAQGADEVAAANDRLVQATSADRIIENLLQQVSAVQSFQENLTTLLELGLDDLVQALIAQGPIVGGAAAQALVGDETKARMTEGILEFQQDTDAGFAEFAERAAIAAALAGDEVGTAAATGLQTGATATLPGSISFIESQLDEQFPTIFTNTPGQAKTAGEEISSAFGGGLSDGRSGLGAQTGFGFGLAETQQEQSADVIAFNARLAGARIGVAFGSGIRAGLQIMATPVKNAAEELIEAAEEGIREAAGISSPSRLFADLGRDMAAGLEQGWLGGVSDLRIASGELVGATAGPLATATLEPAATPGRGVVVQGPLIGEVNENADPLHISAELAWRLAP